MEANPFHLEVLKADLNVYDPDANVHNWEVSGSPHSDEGGDELSEETRLTLESFLDDTIDMDHMLVALVNIQHRSHKWTSTTPPPSPPPPSSPGSHSDSSLHLLPKKDLQKTNIKSNCNTWTPTLDHAHQHCSATSASGVATTKLALDGAGRWVRCRVVGIERCRSKPHLGLAIEGGSDTECRDACRVIAVCDKRLRDVINVGDLMLEVDHIRLVGLKHRDAAKVVSERYASKEAGAVMTVTFYSPRLATTTRLSQNRAFGQPRVTFTSKLI